MTSQIVKIGYIIVMVFALTACDRFSKEERIAHRLMYTTSKILESRYNLSYSGRHERGDKDVYKAMGLYFKRFGIISKDEGRKMIIDCVNVFLNEINSDPKMRPYLSNYPFTIANIDITINVVTDDWKDVFYPDIKGFSVDGGKIRYKTKLPDNEYDYQEETFEEALRLVEMQNKEIL